MGKAVYARMRLAWDQHEYAKVVEEYEAALRQDFDVDDTEAVELLLKAYAEDGNVPAIELFLSARTQAGLPNDLRFALPLGELARVRSAVPVALVLERARPWLQ